MWSSPYCPTYLWVEVERRNLINFDSNSQYQEVPLQDKGVGVGGIVSVLFSPPHPREGNKVALQRAGAEQTNAIQILLITPRYESHLAYAWHIRHTIKYFCIRDKHLLLTLVYQEGGIYFVKKQHVSSQNIFQQIVYDETLQSHTYIWKEQKMLSFKLDYYGIWQNMWCRHILTFLFFIFYD